MGLVYSEPKVAQSDLLRAGIAFALLAAAETEEGSRGVGLLPVVLLGWFGRMALRRYKSDPRTPTVFGVQCLFVLIAGLTSTLWWLTMLLCVVVAVAKRVGVPPFPVLIAHMLDKVAPQQVYETYQAAQLGNSRWSEFPVVTPDGAKLFALRYKPPGEPTRRWAIFFNGNAMLVQNTLDVHMRFADQMRCNMVAFNYRGCGGSQGFPSTGSDLVADGVAVLEAVTKHSGLDPNEVLLYGISLGGCVATLVRALPQYRNGPLLVDRSFSTIVDAAMCMFRPLEKALGRAVPWITELVVMPVLELAGWNMLSPSEYIADIKGPKILTHHLLDGVLPPGCQTYEKSQLSSTDHSIRLSTSGYGPSASNSYHCFLLTDDPSWPGIKSKLEMMF